MCIFEEMDYGKVKIVVASQERRDATTLKN